MPVQKGPDCVGDEMRRFKNKDLHSGTGKKGKKGKVVKDRKQAIAIALSACGKSKYAEQLEGLGYSEEAAAAVAQVYDFVTAKEVEEEADKGYTSDIDSTPGKQKGTSARRKQPQQESQATFPTLPKEGYAEGALIKAKKRKCPPGTQAVGAGFCKNPKAGKREYFDIEKGKSCPPGSRSAGKGRCRVDFAEGPTASGDAPTAAAKAIANTPCEQKRKREPQVVKPTQPTQPTQPNQSQQTTQNQTPAAVAARDAAKARAERCAKNSGTQSNNAVSKPAFKEMHQSINEKRRKIKELQREGHPASILIKQVKDHS